MRFSIALLISISAHVAVGSTLGANINNDPGFVCKPGNVPYTCFNGNLVPREVTVSSLFLYCAGWLAMFLLQRCSESMYRGRDPFTIAFHRAEDDLAF
ncbi:hypothetical protein PspLS_00183, partial [Pyricularia sp. CBS 133598]